MLVENYSCIGFNPALITTMRQMATVSWNMKTERKESVSGFNIIDNGGRRKNGDRRTFSYTVHIPERRCGEDRRTGKDRRQHNRFLGGQ